MVKKIILIASIFLMTHIHAQDSILPIREDNLSGLLSDLRAAKDDFERRKKTLYSINTSFKPCVKKTPSPTLSHR
jgi:hypothetical protein